VQFTGTFRRASTEILLDPAAEVNSGLRKTSIAVCTNVLTLDKGLLGRRIGSLSLAAMQRIESTLKTALDLP
jgi:mRNA-degrading endonuclease toxin of MazEF toxin-antitoxin module